MNYYTCTDQRCPDRNPVEASEAPTCYTCGAKMGTSAPRLQDLVQITIDADPTGRAPHIYRANDAVVTVSGVRVTGLVSEGNGLYSFEPTPKHMAEWASKTPCQMMMVGEFDGHTCGIVPTVGGNGLYRYCAAHFDMVIRAGSSTAVRDEDQEARNQRAVDLSA